jgi:PhoH-like ATPase
VYQGITVVENFNGWDDWFSKDKCILLSKLPPGEYHENMGIVFKGDNEALGTKEHGIVRGDKVVQTKRYFPCGLKALNTEQTIALDLLNDDSVPLVTLLGSAGSGKTLLSSAHALHSLKKGFVNKIVIAKSMTPVGRDVGYLKGTLEEKVIPWLGPFFDAFEKCGEPKFVIERMIADGKIEISPISFIQGRSFNNTILVVDEVQNLSMEIIKQVITRAGEKCKVLLLGDPSQRFERGNVDLDLFVEKAKASDLIGHVFFRKSVRSKLAEWGVNNL